MKVLFTGACGYAGSHVCTSLIEKGFDIRAADINDCASLGLDIQHADMRNFDECRRIVEGVETIVHFAAHPSEHGRDPRKVYIENVVISLNIMHAGMLAGAKRFIYASSIQVITASRPRPGYKFDIPPSSLPYLPADGDIPPNPSNYYGLSKQACEEQLRFFSKKFGVTCIAFRFPWLMNLERLTRVLQRYNSSQPARVSLDECFSYLSFGDITNLLIAVFNSSLTGFRIYMPASAHTLLQRPVEEIVEKYYKGIPIHVPVEEMEGLVDLSALEKDIGWRPLN